MDIIILIMGLFMIGSGFLVKSLPNLIAGYNTMPKERKKNVDIEGLSTYIRNSLIIIGLSIMVGYYLFKWLGFEAIANSMILIITLIGAIIMVINAQKFDRNKKQTKRLKLTYFIIGLVIAFVIGLLTYGYLPSKAVISNDTVRFTGMYGFEMNVSEIDDIKLMDTIPAIKIRTNGFSAGLVNKGFFNLDKIGKTRLLIHSNKPPYIIIYRSNANDIIINFKDKSETEHLFNRIKELINN